MLTILIAIQQVITAGRPPKIPLCVAIPIAILVFILYSRAGLRGWNGR